MKRRDHTLREVDFLGTGWAFPVVPGGRGRVQTADSEESISQAIWIILATAVIGWLLGIATSVVSAHRTRRQV